MGNNRTGYDSCILIPFNLGPWRHNFLLALFLVLALICNVLKTEDSKSGNALEMNWVKQFTDFKTAHNRNKSRSMEDQIEINVSCILSVGCFSLKIESPDCQDGVLKDNFQKYLKIETAATTSQCLHTPSIIVQWMLDSTVAQGQDVKRCMYSLACVVPRRMLISTNGLLRWIEISVVTSEAAKGSIFTTLKTTKQDEMYDIKQSPRNYPVDRNSNFIQDTSPVINNTSKKNAYEQERLWISHNSVNEMPKVHNLGKRKQTHGVKSSDEIGLSKNTQVKDGNPTENKSRSSLHLSENGQTYSHVPVAESDPLRNQRVQNVSGTNFTLPTAASHHDKAGDVTSAFHHLLSVLLQDRRMRSKREAAVTGANDLVMPDKNAPENKANISDIVNSNASFPQTLDKPVLKANVANKSQKHVEHGLENITVNLREKDEDLFEPESSNFESMIQTLAVLSRHVPEPLVMPASRIGRSVDYPRKRYIWSQWGAWSQCSVSCGEGTTERVRVCVDAGHSQFIKTLLKHCNIGPSSQRRLCTRTCVVPVAAGAAAAAAAAVGGAAVATGQVPENSPDDNEEWDDDDEDVVNVEDSDSASLTGPAAVAGAAGAAGVVAAGSSQVLLEQGESSGPVISQAEGENTEDKLTAETIVFIIILVLSLVLFLISFCIWMCFRYQDHREKAKLARVLPFYKDEEDGMVPSPGDTDKDSAVARPVQRSSGGSTATGQYGSRQTFASDIDSRYSSFMMHPSTISGFDLDREKSYLTPSEFAAGGRKNWASLQSEGGMQQRQALQDKLVFDASRTPSGRMSVHGQIKGGDNGPGKSKTTVRDRIRGSDVPAQKHSVEPHFNERLPKGVLRRSESEILEPGKSRSEMPELRHSMRPRSSEKISILRKGAEESIEGMELRKGKSRDTPELRHSGEPGANERKPSESRKGTDGSIRWSTPEYWEPREGRAEVEKSVELRASERKSMGDEMLKPQRPSMASYIGEKKSLGSRKGTGEPVQQIESEILQQRKSKRSEDSEPKQSVVPRASERLNSGSKRGTEDEVVERRKSKKSEDSEPKQSVVPRTSERPSSGSKRDTENEMDEPRKSKRSQGSELRQSYFVPWVNERVSSGSKRGTENEMVEPRKSKRSQGSQQKQSGVPRASERERIPSESEKEAEDEGLEPSETPLSESRKGTVNEVLEPSENKANEESEQGQLVEPRTSEVPFSESRKRMQGSKKSLNPKESQEFLDWRHSWPYDRMSWETRKGSGASLLGELPESQGSDMFVTGGDAEFPDEPGSDMFLTSGDAEFPDEKGSDTFLPKELSPASDPSLPVPSEFFQQKKHDENGLFSSATTLDSSISVILEPDNIYQTFSSELVKESDVIDEAKERDVIDEEKKDDDFDDEPQEEVPVIDEEEKEDNTDSGELSGLRKKKKDKKGKKGKKGKKKDSEMKEEDTEIEQGKKGKKKMLKKHAKLLVRMLRHARSKSIPADAGISGTVGRQRLISNALTQQKPSRPAVRRMNDYLEVEKADEDEAEYEHVMTNPQPFTEKKLLDAVVKKSVLKSSSPSARHPQSSGTVDSHSSHSSGPETNLKGKTSQSCTDRLLEEFMNKLGSHVKKKLMMSLRSKIEKVVYDFDSGREVTKIPERSSKNPPSSSTLDRTENDCLKDESSDGAAVKDTTTSILNRNMKKPNGKSTLGSQSSLPSFSAGSCSAEVKHNISDPWLSALLQESDKTLNDIDRDIDCVFRENGYNTELDSKQRDGTRKNILSSKEWPRPTASEQLKLIEVCGEASMRGIDTVRGTGKKETGHNNTKIWLSNEEGETKGILCLEKSQCGSKPCESSTTVTKLGKRGKAIEVSPCTSQRSYEEKKTDVLKLVQAFPNPRQWAHEDVNQRAQAQADQTCLTCSFSYFKQEPLTEVRTTLNSKGSGSSCQSQTMLQERRASFKTCANNLDIGYGYGQKDEVSESADRKGKSGVELLENVWKIELQQMLRKKKDRVENKAHFENKYMVSSGKTPVDNEVMMSLHNTEQDIDKLDSNHEQIKMKDIQKQAVDEHEIIESKSCVPVIDADDSDLKEKKSDISIRGESSAFTAVAHFSNVKKQLSTTEKESHRQIPTIPPNVSAMPREEVEELKSVDVLKKKSAFQKASDMRLQDLSQILNMQIETFAKSASEQSHRSPRKIRVNWSQIEVRPKQFKPGNKSPPYTTHSQGSSRVHVRSYQKMLPQVRMASKPGAGDVKSLVFSLKAENKQNLPSSFQFTKKMKDDSEHIRNQPACSLPSINPANKLQPENDSKSGTSSVNGNLKRSPQHSHDSPTLPRKIMQRCVVFGQEDIQCSLHDKKQDEQHSVRQQIQRVIPPGAEWKIETYPVSEVQHDSDSQRMHSHVSGKSACESEKVQEGGSCKSIVQAHHSEIVDRSVVPLGPHVITLDVPVDNTKVTLTTHAESECAAVLQFRPAKVSATRNSREGSPVSQEPTGESCVNSCSCASPDIWSTPPESMASQKHWALSYKNTQTNAVAQNSKLMDKPFTHYQQSSCPKYSKSAASCDSRKFKSPLRYSGWSMASPSHASHSSSETLDEESKQVLFTCNSDMSLKSCYSEKYTSLYPLEKPSLKEMDIPSSYRYYSEHPHHQSKSIDSPDLHTSVSKPKLGGNCMSDLNQSSSNSNVDTCKKDVKQDVKDVNSLGLPRKMGTAESVHPQPTKVSEINQNGKAEVSGPSVACPSRSSSFFEKRVSWSPYSDVCMDSSFASSTSPSSPGFVNTKNMDVVKEMSTADVQEDSITVKRTPSRILESESNSSMLTLRQISSIQDESITFEKKFDSTKPLYSLTSDVDLFSSLVQVSRDQRKNTASKPYFQTEKYFGCLRRSSQHQEPRCALTPRAIVKTSQLMEQTVSTVSVTSERTTDAKNIASGVSDFSFTNSSFDNKAKKSPLRRNTSENILNNSNDALQSPLSSCDDGLSIEANLQLDLTGTCVRQAHDHCPSPLFETLISSTESSLALSESTMLTPSGSTKDREYRWNPQVDKEPKGVPEPIPQIAYCPPKVRALFSLDDANACSDIGEHLETPPDFQGCVHRSNITSVSSDISGTICERLHLNEEETPNYPPESSHHLGHRSNYNTSRLISDRSAFRDGSFKETKTEVEWHPLRLRDGREDYEDSRQDRYLLDSDRSLEQEQPGKFRTNIEYHRTQRAKQSTGSRVPGPHHKELNALWQLSPARCMYSPESASHFEIRSTQKVLFSVAHPHSGEEERNREASYLRHTDI